MAKLVVFWQDLKVLINKITWTQGLPKLMSVFIFHWKQILTQTLTSPKQGLFGMHAKLLIDSRKKKEQTACTNEWTNHLSLFLTNNYCTANIYIYIAPVMTILMKSIYPFLVTFLFQASCLTVGYTTHKSEATVNAPLFHGKKTCWAKDWSLSWIPVLHAIFSQFFMFFF